MIKINIDQHSDAWFKIRMGRITASKFANLMASENTVGYKGLITDIASERIINEIDDPYFDSNMERGIELEPEACNYYSEIHETQIEKVGFCIPDEDDEFHEWIGASPDRLVGDNGILEVKCPQKRAHWDYIKSNKLPNKYKYQVYGLLYVTKLNWCDFMSYYPNLKPFIIRVYPDKEIFNDIEIKIRKTIELIEEDIKIYKNYDYLQ